jgi:hypothetical protein
VRAYLAGIIHVQDIVAPLVIMAGQALEGSLTLAGGRTGTEIAEFLGFRYPGPGWGGVFGLG